MTAMAYQRRRGAPVVMLALLLMGWVGARALIWESPFADTSIFPMLDDLRADAGSTGNREQAGNPWIGATDPFSKMIPRQMPQSNGAGTSLALSSSASFAPFDHRQYKDNAVEFGHSRLWLAAMSTERGRPADRFGSFAALAPPTRVRGINPVTPALPSDVGRSDRWSVDAWGFWRQGSGSTAISQGRVPIYGANQIGAALQYRARPSSAHDPRLYLRGYRALVANGETEIALGASARPLGDLPVRVAAELRVTESQFGTNLRPAVGAATELVPLQIPGDFRLEVYGGAGFVAGKGSTPFVDGQASVTREVVKIDGVAGAQPRLSIGAGAWGGAQKDASRIDIGPTVRMDLTLGDVPARLSVDWREQVGGDAAPDSGIAATLSTRF